MYLRKVLLALLIFSLSPMALAMSLGEGEILNRVGEAFSANISLNGRFSKDVSFSQAGNAECRSSFIDNTTCASLYSGRLIFSVKKQPDGRYLLNVAGEKGNELFYRVLIKSTSPATGKVYKIYEFLPEFNPDPDEPPLASVASFVHETVNTAAPNVNSIDETVELFQVTARPHSAIIHKLPDQLNKNHDEVLPEKALKTRLEIKKYGESGDDIQALRKENSEIEAQISLLQKHISLLKEVIRLKSEAGAMPKQLAVRPKAIPLQRQSLPSDKPDLLIWILLAVIFAFSLLIIGMYQKLKQLNLKYATVVPAIGKIASARVSANKSLDLTGAITRAK